jgi:hypothetical protein
MIGKQGDAPHVFFPHRELGFSIEKPAASGPAAKRPKTKVCPREKERMMVRWYECLKDGTGQLAGSCTKELKRAN